MYYLQSRDYNPEWGRFINFDNYGGSIGELLSHNGYSYCKNNPINMVDSNGKFALAGLLTGITIGKIAEGLLAIAATLLAIWTTATIVNEIKKVQDQKVDERNNTVYRLFNPDTDETKYIGRTTNPNNRKANHMKNPIKGKYEFQIMAEKLTLSEARGLEQILIISNHTLITGINKINGISPKNKNLEYYMQEGRNAAEFLADRIENEALYWTGQ